MPLNFETEVERKLDRRRDPEEIERIYKKNRILDGLQAQRDSVSFDLTNKIKDAVAQYEHSPFFNSVYIVDHRMAIEAYRLLIDERTENVKSGKVTISRYSTGVLRVEMYFGGRYWRSFVSFTPRSWSSDPIFELWSAINNSLTELSLKISEERNKNRIERFPKPDDYEWRVNSYKTDNIHQYIHDDAKNFEQYVKKFKEGS